jgi:hypothetical protein
MTASRAMRGGMDETFSQGKTIDENIQETPDATSNKDKPKAGNYHQNRIRINHFYCQQRRAGFAIRINGYRDVNTSLIWQLPLPLLLQYSTDAIPSQEVPFSSVYLSLMILKVLILALIF